MGRHPFEEHLPRLRRYALALMRDRMRADDLVQDTLERALRKFSLFRRSTDLRAWLFTIMHNVHVNQIRAATATARTQPDDAGSEPAHSPPDDAATARDISNALQHLAPEHREVILLVGLEQLTYAETARVLDVPIGTVMSRLTRARERLRALMSGETSPTLRRVK